jgi:hypothetical protein
MENHEKEALNYFIYFLEVVIISMMYIGLTSCRSLRKTTSKMSTNYENNYTRKDSVASAEAYFVDTTKTASKTVEYKKVEYYPPAPEQSSPAIPIIKSITTIAVSEISEDKGIAKKDSNHIATTSVVRDSSSDVVAITTSEPGKDPYRWRYFFYVVVIAAGIFLYIKKAAIFGKIGLFVSKVWQWIKSIV